MPTEQHAALRELVTDIDAGRVQMLVIIGESNPVYSGAGRLEVRTRRWRKVACVIHSGLFFDETATLSHWHVPAAHYLEAWSDARSYRRHRLDRAAADPAALRRQVGARSDRDDVGAAGAQRLRRGPGVLAGERAGAARAAVQASGSSGSCGRSDVRAGLRSRLREAHPSTVRPRSRQRAGVTCIAAATFEKSWRKWLHDGFIAGTAARRRAPTTVAPDVGDAHRRSPAAPIDGIEVNFRRDPTIYDGRFANNGWLQELPKPMTKLTWDNAALIAPATAEAHELQNGDIIEIAARQAARSTCRCGSSRATPRMRSRSRVGYGRTRAGRVGNGTGFNTYALRGSRRRRSSARRRSARPATTTTWPARRTTGRSSPQHPALGDARGVQGEPGVRQEDGARRAEDGSRISLYPDDEYSGQQWGMAIDLNTCTGCGACVIACVAENNIPVVGKEQVERNREMHWLRIDRYFAGDADTPDTYYQPMPCQQCENAPCEVVCPVSATVHSAEGLNDMVYNRCVGTRYCSNNCPWKVRRFNFLLYQDWNTPQFKLQRNPDVTVRSRGIMEKCTYCVQRINAARIQAKREDRDDSRRRDRHRLPGGVPDRSDRVRQHQRSEQPRGASSRRARATTRRSRISTRGRARRISRR